MASLIVQEPDLKIKDIPVSAKHCDSSLVTYLFACLLPMLPMFLFQIISNGLSYSFLWELVYTNAALNLVKAEFNVRYKLSEEEDTYKTYQYYFDIIDFKVSFRL